MSFIPDVKIRLPTRFISAKAAPGIPSEKHATLCLPMQSLPQRAISETKHQPYKTNAHQPHLIQLASQRKFPTCVEGNVLAESLSSRDVRPTLLLAAEKGRPTGKYPAWCVLLFPAICSSRCYRSYRLISRR